MSFEGFNRDFVEFLFGLGFTNNREQLEENKIRYKALITAPLTELYQELIPVVQSVDAGLEIKRQRCVSPMYNDMRFSYGTPLREYMFLRFRVPFKEEDALAFYFDMGYSGYSYGIHVYRRTSAGMRRIRGHILKNQTKWHKALKDIDATGSKVYGDFYKRNHFPEVKDEKILSLLNRKTLDFISDKYINDNVFSSALFEELSTNYQKLGNAFLLMKEALYENTEEA